MNGRDREIAPTRRDFERKVSGVGFGKSRGMKLGFTMSLMVYDSI